MLSNTGLTRMYAFRRGDCHIDGSHCTVVIGCCVGYSHLTTVDVSHNQITDLTHLPKSVRYLDASYNLLTSMAHIDRLTNLICLRLAHNNITAIENLGAAVSGAIHWIRFE